MKRTRNCRAAVILLLMSLFSKPVSAADDIDSYKNLSYSLDSVSVTGSRVPIALGKSARIVTLLDSSAVASLPVESVNDILKYVAGVDVRQRGDMGAQTDISMRGGTSDQIAVFLDGINICDPQTGHNTVDFPVDINDIDHIEVLSGPAGVTYGSSSLVGAINIVTRKTKSNEVSAHIEGGSYGFFNGGARAGFSRRNLSSQISAGYLRSDGFSRNSEGGLNSDYETVKAFWQGTYTSNVADISWHAGLSSRNFGSNTFYSAKYDDQFEHTFKTFAAIQAQTHGFIKFRPAIYWNRGQDRFELIRGNADKVAFNHHRTNVWGVNLNSWFETVIGKTAFGAEMRNEDIISTNLGETLSTPKKVRGTSGANYIKGLNRTNISIFLEHSVDVRNFSANAGVAAVKNTGNEDDFKFYPGVNVSYRFLGDWKVYASYNSSLRMPTFTELYYSVGGHQADKNLKAEKMQSVEGGLRFSRPWINAVATIYYNMGSDMIDWTKDLSEGEDAQWKSCNYAKINTFGQELSVRMDFPSMLVRNDFFLRTLDVSYSHISQDKKTEKNIQSKYALEYLKHKVVVKADFHIWKGLCANASWRWQDRKGNYEKFVDKVSQGTVAYKPYSLVDARVSWTDKCSRARKAAFSYSIYAEVNNVLNHKYFDYGNVPQPGIMAKAGLIVNVGGRH